MDIFVAIYNSIKIKFMHILRSYSSTSRRSSVLDIYIYIYRYTESFIQTLMSDKKVISVDHQSDMNLKIMI